jgi:hypothetical protein
LTSRTENLWFNSLSQLFYDFLSILINLLNKSSDSCATHITKATNNNICKSIACGSNGLQLVIFRRKKEQQDLKTIEKKSFLFLRSRKNGNHKKKRVCGHQLRADGEGNDRFFPND